MTLALTGFMGSGKTTVGRALATRLGCPFADLDALVEKAAGKTVPQIFEDEGEPGFRAREVQALSEALTPDSGTEGDLVLSLGGGTLLSPEAGRLVAEHCICVWLKASAGTLAERLEGQAADRPLLAGRNLRTRIADLLAQREEIYRNAAGVVIDTDGLAPEEIANRILEKLK